jgi:hypothetical protein
VPSLSMSSDARTVPAGLPAAERPAAAGGRLSRGLELARRRELAGSDTAVLVGALTLVTIVALSLLLVLVAANRPSLLTPTTHTGYFPRWMAGPLGGLLPGFTNDGTTLKNLFTGAMVVMYVSYVVMLKHASRLPGRWVLAAILAVHAIFWTSPPLALTDLFNYINYGRMEVVHNLNPYTTIPILEPHDDPSFILSNWHQLLSPYGPLFTLITFAVVPLGVAGSFWALKSLLVASSLATIWLVGGCARLLGRDRTAAMALVGLNPLILVWGLGGDHNDFLMVLCITLGVYLVLLARERARQVSVAHVLPVALLEVGAGAALVAAVAIKASAAVLLPIVLVTLLGARRTLVRVLAGMALAGVVLGAGSFAAFGLHFPDLSTQSSLVTGESLPNLVGLALGFGGESAGVRYGMDVVLVLTALACCWLAWRRRELVTPAGWASVALVATLGWVLPWYVLWVLPFAALSSSRRLRAAALVLGAYLILSWAPSSGAFWHSIGFHPERTPLGRLHQRYVKELLD